MTRETGCMPILLITLLIWGGLITLFFLVITR
mgnify:CR=1 FL=1